MGTGCILELTTVNRKDQVQGVDIFNAAPPGHPEAISRGDEVGLRRAVGIIQGKAGPFDGDINLEVIRSVVVYHCCELGVVSDDQEARGDQRPFPPGGPDEPGSPGRRRTL